MVGDGVRCCSVKNFLGFTWILESAMYVHRDFVTLKWTCYKSIKILSLKDLKSNLSYYQSEDWRRKSFEDHCQEVQFCSWMVVWDLQLNPQLEELCKCFVNNIFYFCIILFHHILISHFVLITPKSFHLVVRLCYPVSNTCSNMFGWIMKDRKSVV